MMKRISLICFLICLGKVSHSQTTNPAPYCYAGYDDDSIVKPYAIKQVTLLGNTVTLSQSSGVLPAPHYIYFNNLSPVDLMTGYIYTMQFETDTVNVVSYVNMFIDFNQDGIFSSNEWTDLGRMLPSASYNVSFIIPFGACAGLTRMRMLICDDRDPSVSTHLPGYACTIIQSDTIDWGVTEDFDVTIQVSPTDTFPSSCVSVGLVQPLDQQVFLWSNGQLTYKGVETLEDVRFYNCLGQLLYVKPKLPSNASIELSQNQQVLFFSARIHSKQLSGNVILLD